MVKKGSNTLIFEKQWLHLLLLAVLLTGVVLVSEIDAVEGGALWGVPSPTWLWVAVTVAVAHQGLVWFCWRTQLHLGLLTRAFGKAGFVIYAVLFAILGIARVVAVFLLALSNQGTVAADVSLLRVLAALATLPALYLFYSVHRYFGFRRAFGIDHFDPSYRKMPFVKKGIFKYTNNGMYTYGFLLLWVPALWWGSAAALAAALFNHLYIWVHYFSTERPDIRRIYA
ncbi:MAG: methyltransferase [bacterium]